MTVSTWRVEAPNSFSTYQTTFSQQEPHVDTLLGKLFHNLATQKFNFEKDVHRQQHLNNQCEGVRVSSNAKRLAYN